MTTQAERAAAAGLSEAEVEDLKTAAAENRMADADEKADDKADETAKADEKADDAKADAKDETADAKADSADEADASADEPERQAPFVPTFAANSPEGMAERLTAIKAEQKAALVKFGAGELTAEEYADANEALQTERDDLVTRKSQVEAAQQHNQRTIEQAIEHERKSFIRDAKKEGIDYSNPVLRAALDTAFAAIATDPKNKDRTIDDAYATFEEAHQTVKTAIGWKPPTPKADPKPAPPPAPKTLAGIPAAAPAATGDDVMDKINTLSGEDLEVFIAKMSPADRKALSRRAQ